MPAITQVGPTKFASRSGTMQRSTYVGSDRAVLARIAEQQKADATAAYLRARAHVI